MIRSARLSVSLPAPLLHQLFYPVGEGDPPEILVARVAFLAGTIVAHLRYRMKVGLITGRAHNDPGRWKNEHTKEIRNDPVNCLRSMLKGRIPEQMAPLLSEFSCAPADARFIGNPADFVVFGGYTEAKDGDGSPIRGVLVEMKKGAGRLFRTEHLIGRSVEEGRVSWKTRARFIAGTGKLRDRKRKRLEILSGLCRVIPG